MNRLRLFCTIVMISTSASAGLYAQNADSLGLPGDNLDLYGVLDLFKKSENPEEFEKALNNPDTKLNNLDLNGDNEIDYIRVIDRTEGDLHALVLQIPVDADESQDVAVIEIEKKADGTANIQIVGDEELYGKKYILEPAEENKKSAPSAEQPSNTKTQTATPATVINVYTWPSVSYIYRPVYTPWVSPWRWHYYPPAWRPWRPIYWAAYYPHWHHYHFYHHRVYSYGIVRAHDMYYGHRVISRTVYQKRSSPSRQASAVRPHRTTKQQRSGRQRTSAPRTNSRQREQVKAPRQRNGGSRPSGGNNTGGGRRK